MTANRLPDAKLIPIKNTERDDLQGDIIFVHGLNGNGQDTGVQTTIPTVSGLSG